MNIVNIALYAIIAFGIFLPIFLLVVKIFRGEFALSSLADNFREGKENSDK